MSSAHSKYDWIPRYIDFGYVPIPSNKFLRFFIRPDLARLDVVEAARIGSTLWLDTIERLSASGAADHVVPLSGGLDSRAILAGLLRSYNSSSLRTITFGVPGSLDVELAKKVSKRAGVRWEFVDLSESKFEWTYDDLLSIASTLTHPLPLFECLFNRAVLPKDGTLWSGFLGGPTSGAHLPTTKNVTTYDEAWRVFERGKPSDEASPLEPVPFIANASAFESIDPNINPLDVLNVGLRQTNYIYPVLGLSEHQNAKLPFADKAWCAFAFSLPVHLRRRQSWYKEMLVRLDRRLFSIGTKSRYGAPVNSRAPKSTLYRLLYLARRLFLREAPMLNYVDFGASLSENRSLRTIVRDAGSSFDARSVPGVPSLKEAYSRFSTNRSDLHNCERLLRLTSLEIWLRSRETSPNSRCRP